MLSDAIREVKRIDSILREGRVVSVEGLRIGAAGPGDSLRLGAGVRFGGLDGPRGEIVGFEGERAILLASDPIDGVRPGAAVLFESDADTVRPCGAWLGRVLDAFGAPVDGKGALAQGGLARPVRASPPQARSRGRVSERATLGVRALDLFTPCAFGQRLGVFAGSGVGKSTLMSMLTRRAEADVVVIGLIGERGREVREFVEDVLGPEGLARAVIVTSTSDEPAPRRRRAAWLTLAVAEHFRDEGLRVLCFIDSVTRFAMAQREIGLAAGEPPTTRGYTPSVFAELPKLLERAGPGLSEEAGGRGGCITGMFTVLVEGDDLNEPVADAVRGILDGHVSLSREIAERGRYPAIDVSRSLSRLSNSLQTEGERRLVAEARRLIALYADMAELVRIGAYAAGSDPDVDRAVRLWPAIEAVLAQEVDEASDVDGAARALAEVIGRDQAATAMART
ncbi:flagellar protein export ATPase FliI [bacterium]|nr:flagellar protein export ATPase FliI [bacterium]